MANGIGPRDLTATNEDAVGGNMFAVARFEADFPVGLPEEYGIKGGAFLDVGSVWGLDNSLSSAIDDSAKLRSTVGVSVLWETPIGPLRFNFSKALKKESYDKERRFVLATARTITRTDEDGETFEETILPVAEEDGALVIRFDYLGKLLTKALA